MIYQNRFRAVIEAPVRRLRKLIGYNQLYVRQAWKLAGVSSAGVDWRRQGDCEGKKSAMRDHAAERTGATPRQEIVAHYIPVREKSGLRFLPKDDRVI